MDLLFEKLKGLKNFLYILLALLLVNGLFNLKYDWGGVSIIVRVYIMVLSFYIIYIFSQIDLDLYRENFKAKYGLAGNYILFFNLRGAPIIFIYLMTAAFTIVSSVHLQNWPAEPIFRLMDGRYSNTIFYVLILFLVLKQNKRPGIAIPLFIFYSVAFFIIDKVLYSSFEAGYEIGSIKFIKYFIFMFVLFYDSLYEKGRVIKSAVAALFAGCFFFFMIIAVNLVIFNYSEKQGYAYITSANLLLKTGVKYPLNELGKIIPDKNGMVNVVNFISFSNRFNREIDYTADQWADIITRSDMTSGDFIFDYLFKKNVEIDFNVLKRYATNQALLNPEGFLAAEHFKRFFARYFSGREKHFFEMFMTGNLEMKLWIIDTLEYTESIYAAEFLVPYLTDINRQISEKAYLAIEGITGFDPSSDMKKDIYDLEVVAAFREFLLKRKIK